MSWEAGPEHTGGKLSANPGLEPSSFGRPSSWEKQETALEDTPHSFFPLCKCAVPPGFGEVCMAPARAPPPCSWPLSSTGGSLASTVSQGSPTTWEGDLAPAIPRLLVRASGLMSLQQG